MQDNQTWSTATTNTRVCWWWFWQAKFCKLPRVKIAHLHRNLSQSCAISLRKKCFLTANRNPWINVDLLPFFPSSQHLWGHMWNQMSSLGLSSTGRTWTYWWESSGDHHNGQGLLWVGHPEQRPTNDPFNLNYSMIQWALTKPGMVTHSECGCEVHSDGCFSPNCTYLKQVVKIAAGCAGSFSSKQRTGTYGRLLSIALHEKHLRLEVDPPALMPHRSIHVEKMAGIVN